MNIIIYTTQQVASMFGVEDKTVRGWAKKGIIPTKKIGKRWFFEEKVVLDFLRTFKKKND